MHSYEKIYKYIFEKLNDGIMVLDLKGKIMSFNPRAAEILNINVEETVDRTFAEVFFGDPDNDDFNETIIEAIHKANTIVDKEVSFNTGEKKVNLHVNTILLKETQKGQEETLGVVVVINDITETLKLRAAEKKFTKELKDKNQELKDAFIEVEESKKHLEFMLKKIQVVRVSVSVFFVLLFCSIVYFSWNKGSDLEVSDKKTTRKFTDIIKIQKQPITQKLQIAGLLAPKTITRILSPMDSRVISKYFSYGKFVKKGDSLILLDLDDLSYKLAGFEKAYYKAKKQLNQLKDWQNSAVVKKARYALEKKKLAVEAAKKKEQENQLLFKHGAIAESSLIKSKQDFQDLVADYSFAKADFKTLQGKGGINQIRIAKYEYKKAKDELDEAKKLLKSNMLKAPISGVVLQPEESSKKLRARQSVRKEELLFEIGDTEDFNIICKVDELDVANLYKNQKIKITISALPGSGFSGRISNISPQAQVSGRDQQPYYEVVVSFDKLTTEEKAKLKLGMSIDIEAITYNKKESLMVPLDSVMLEGSTKSVMVKKSKLGKLKKRAVQTGVVTKEGVEIKKGLKEGEWVAY
jgi:HlyD family secretion protein